MAYEKPINHGTERMILQRDYFIYDRLFSRKTQTNFTSKLSSPDSIKFLQNDNVLLTKETITT